MTATRTTRVRGLAPWQPHRATVDLLGKVQTVLAEYQEYLPLTLRQVFYRLVGAHGFGKTEPAYARLGEHLNRARRAGLIAFGAIRDDGITLAEPSEWDSAEQLVRTFIAEAQQFRLDRQRGQPTWLIFAVEAAGMLPQVQRIADPYGIAVHSSGGFDSLTAKHDLAKGWAPGRAWRCCTSATTIRPASICSPRWRRTSWPLPTTSVCMAIYDFPGLP